jgi:hypothetical protein
MLFRDIQENAIPMRRAAGPPVALMRKKKVREEGK